MSRNKFHEIKRYLHHADNNNLVEDDKLAKIRKYLDLLNRNFTQFGVFSQNLSVDDQTVPYYRHFFTKIFTRNKPIKFGKKVRFLASSQGYPFSFQVYTGKDGSSDQPLRERVVNTLTDVLKNKRSHADYIDNFFSSTILCRDLAMGQLKCTGTIRQNRTQNCPFISSAALKKQERGTFEAFSDGMIVICQRNDNKRVCVVSNFKEVEPTSMVRRWSALKKSAVQIPQPEMVANYNKYMEESISLIGFLVIIAHVYEVRSGGGAFFPIF